jgi:ribonuclease P protein component
VERQGVRTSGDLVTVTVRPGPGRLGFVVSKKVDNRASERNPVKRRLREIMRREKARFVHRSEGSVDVVVTARAAARDVAFDVLRAEVLRILDGALQRLTQGQSSSSRRR